jgi:hypothetical protein
LFEVFARYNPTARLIHPPPAPPDDPVTERYYAALRRYAGPTAHYTFEVEGARPWDVFQRFLSGRLRRSR